ncbi:hypothetical protein BKA69DRAFT_1037809 [Paraphysoderma sedebokerense]|nr:hypothetical protein BKA69DRAFT_1037809 [Paraphysoderma sedebokerense]
MNGEITQQSHQPIPTSGISKPIPVASSPQFNIENEIRHYMTTTFRPVNLRTLLASDKPLCAMGVGDFLQLCSVRLNEFEQTNDEDNFNRMKVLIDELRDLPAIVFAYRLKEIDLEYDVCNYVCSQAETHTGRLVEISKRDTESKLKQQQRNLVEKAEADKQQALTEQRNTLTEMQNEQFDKMFQERMSTLMTSIFPANRERVTQTPAEHTSATTEGGTSRLFMKRQDSLPDPTSAGQPHPSRQPSASEIEVARSYPTTNSDGRIAQTPQGISVSSSLPQYTASQSPPKHIPTVNYSGPIQQPSHPNPHAFVPSAYPRHTVESYPPHTHNSLAPISTSVQPFYRSAPLQFNPTPGYPPTYYGTQFPNNPPPPQMPPSQDRFSYQTLQPSHQRTAVPVNQVPIPEEGPHLGRAELPTTSISQTADDAAMQNVQQQTPSLADPASDESDTQLSSTKNAKSSTTCNAAPNTSLIPDAVTANHATSEKRKHVKPLLDAEVKSKKRNRLLSSDDQSAQLEPSNTPNSSKPLTTMKPTRSVRRHTTSESAHSDSENSVLQSEGGDNNELAPHARGKPAGRLFRGRRKVQTNIVESEEEQSTEETKGLKSKSD